MAYLRIKWIKGNPYLYEQASYRAGSQVKTKHIRYVGKFGYSSSHGEFPSHLPVASDRQAAIDSTLDALTHSTTYPYELAIVRQCLYQHSFPLTINALGDLWLDSMKADGAVKSHKDPDSHLAIAPVVGMILRTTSSPYTWVHEMGHVFDIQDQFLEPAIMALQTEFMQPIEEAYKRANQGNLADKEAFIRAYGPFFDIRRDMEFRRGKTIPIEERFIFKHLERVKSGSFEEDDFNKIFRRWVCPEERFKPQEVVADAVASLIRNENYAFKAHPTTARKYLEKVYIKLFEHLEGNYKITLGRPKKMSSKTR